jgi:hypothetical protein
MKKLLSTILIIFLSGSFFTACKKDKGDPPVLPPQETMLIDFSNFTSAKKSLEVTSDQKGINNTNWEFAAGVAVTWKAIINITLAVPVASFKLATSQSPEYLSTRTWQWSYNATVGSVVYKARLTGEIGASEVTWKMYITKEGTGGFAEFMWFEGTSKIDGTSGQWILKQSASVQEPFLQIDWTKSGTTIGSIKYSFIKNGDPFKTSSIEYGLTSAALNAYYSIHYYNVNLAKFSDVNVEWNTSEKNGRVKCPDYLGDNTWYCWDSNKVNTSCL